MPGATPTIFGPYALLHLLGRGGNGSAYLALRVDRGRRAPLVVKVLHPSAAANPSDRARFAHEAALAVAIDASALATVHDVGLVGDAPYIAMELVRGMSLSHLLGALAESGTFLALPAVLDLMRSALSGLEQLHQATDAQGRALRAIHRDLSPRNLMVERDGRVRILDLGLGRSRLSEVKTRTGVIIGTPGYMSPEQVLGAPVTQRSDVYTVGTILWELLAGRRYIPQGELAVMLADTAKRVFEPPSALRRGLPPRFDEICRRALARDPEQRQASAAELLADLDGVRAELAELTLVAPAVTLAEVYRADLADEELDQLLEGYQASAEEPPAQPTVVLARRPDTEPAAPSTTRPPRGHLPMPFVLAALAIAVVALASALWTGQPPPAAATPPVGPSAPEPSIQARRAPVELEVEPVPEPEVEPPPEPSAPDPRAPRRSPPTTPAPPPPPAVEAGAGALMEHLHQEARAIKRARPELSGAVDDLVNAGLFETAGGDTPKTRARLRELAGELRRLKETAGRPEPLPDR